jgi:hypothetical protein
MRLEDRTCQLCSELSLSGRHLSTPSALAVTSIANIRICQRHLTILESIAGRELAR